MGVFGKLLGKSKKKSKATLEADGKYMPELKTPVDEKFTIHFKKNGGKFLYCNDFSEIIEALENIKDENNWQKHCFYALDPYLQKRFAAENVTFTENIQESAVFFTSCEHLVAHDGSILVCSHQIQEKKPNELPPNLIVFATTSQLVASLGKALETIKAKYTTDIPSNITTLKHFQSPTETNEDFLSYGSTSKNVYLLLLEDF